MSKKDDIQPETSNLALEEDQIVVDDLHTKSANPSADDDSLDDLRLELENVKNLAAQMEVQLKRAVADYQNLEKRVAEGRQELASWATADLLKKLLPVLHSFEQVIKGVGEEERKSSWFRGVELSVKQLQEVLRSEGLDEIEADGQFDPALHEAVDTKEGEHDKIVEVVQKGYTLNRKVLEPAKVIVGRKS